MNHTKPTWGDRDRYYAVDQYQQSRAGRDDGDSLTRRLEALLRNYDAKLPQRVERAFKQWNLIIRDYLRNETALRLAHFSLHRLGPVYQIGVSDPIATEKLNRGETIGRDCLLTVSLTEPVELPQFNLPELCYKVVAAVIEVE